MENQNKESVARLKENKEVYEDPKEICEVLNKIFRNSEIMKELDRKKTIGPDGVSGYI